jgi:hypothetical protein
MGLAFYDPICELTSRWAVEYRQTLIAAEPRLAALGFGVLLSYRQLSRNVTGRSHTCNAVCEILTTDLEARESRRQELADSKLGDWLGLARFGKGWFKGRIKAKSNVTTKYTSREKSRAAFVFAKGGNLPSRQFTPCDRRRRLVQGNKYSLIVGLAT